MEILKVAPHHPLFTLVTQIVEKSYQKYGILDKSECFNEDPDIYLVLRQSDRITGTACIFTQNLPLNQSLEWKNPYPEKKSIEIGRLAFFPNKQNNIKEIFETLVFGLFEFSSAEFGNYEAYFVTHRLLTSLMIEFLDPEFPIPLPFKINWKKIKKGRENFYKMLENGKGGLYRANQKILESIHCQKNLQSLSA